MDVLNFLAIYVRFKIKMRTIVNDVLCCRINIQSAHFRNATSVLN